MFPWTVRTMNTIRAAAMTMSAIPMMVSTDRTSLATAGLGRR